MLSFIEYASRECIQELLIKERVKTALKDKLRKISPVETLQKDNRGELLTVAEQISMLMPPRDSWCRPSRRERQKNGSSERKSSKQILTRSVALTIRMHRKSGKEYPYLKRLDDFIDSLLKDISSKEPLKFNRLKIIGKKKKVNSDGVTILRPLCIFDSLRETVHNDISRKELEELWHYAKSCNIINYTKSISKKAK